MTRAYEIAAALREFSFLAEYGEDADEQEKMTADLYAAADLIENQQRHIEAGWCYRRARYDEEYRMPPDGFCSYGKRKDGGAGE